MKKFGFSKKSEGGDEDSLKASLFSSRSSKNASPAPAASNPYAQQPAADPYAQDNNKYANMGSVGPSGPSPYQAARQNYGLPGGPGAVRGGGLPSGPGAARGGYGGAAAVDRTPAANGGGYGADKYGSGGGYGSNRYDAAPSYGADSGSKYGPGGYGGLGRTNSNDTTTTDDNRDALFGGAKDRYAQKSALPPSNGRPGGGYTAESGASGGSGYGAYGEERQLTAEEEEEEDVAATKQQIRFMKQEDVSSTRNALRIAAQAEETGRATLARLGAQGERIHNTEKNLDLAANHNRVAEEKAKELKTLNKSMFAVHVSNPFTAKSRRAARDDEIIEKHRSEREQRDQTRQAAFGTQQRMERAFSELQPGDVGYRAPQTKASLAERSKYQFEADSEDDEMENEIDSNLDALGHAAGRLNALARATGKEVDEQNKHIDRIIQKSDRVDDQIAMNRARLDRIR
ncbi:probable protein transport protein SEC9 [Phialocephala subalpina]|uniref:Protein transport protein SEC9 n=1 Tax=Phialocephala subalpina TaxID=576137 RepID=A0A1L7WCL6_9HELO|nr:probable protein transport protein SEC9 [Phialocephala subalpina]